jgi:hypothetical protein
MKQAIILSSAIAIAIAGCAKNPAKIQAAYVSTSPYMAMNCAALAEARTKTSAELTKVSQQQRNARNADIAGVLLVGVPAASLTGGDQEDEVGKLKGTLIAIGEAENSKGC